MKHDTVFLGIDVHKKTYAVTAVSDSRIIKRNTMEACPQTLVKYCKKYFPNQHVKSAYEAGFCGFFLHRVLRANEIDNIVVHAASIEIAARDRVKTDKRDSQKIAIQLEAGRLKCIHIPTPEQEAFRFISRLREQLVRDRTRIGVQIKSFLNLNGISSERFQKRVSRTFVKDILTIEDESDIIFYLQTMAKRWASTDSEIKEIEKRLSVQAKSQFDLERIVRSVPGIGPLASRILINELGDMSQFKNERSLFSFTGLTPQEYSSGEHIRQGHISRQGRAILRKILVQAAWKAIRKDLKLREVFEKICIRAGKKRAIIGIARRLIGHLRACLRKKEEYSYKG